MSGDENEPDIVAELDRWLAETVNEIYGPTPVMVRRARDEIVALRQRIVRLERVCAEQRERDARIAAHGVFIQARDTEWDEGVNYARRVLAAAIRNQGDET